MMYRRNRFKTARALLLALAAVALIASPAVASAQSANPRQQYVHVLRLTPQMHDPGAWTEAENRIIGQHFARLAQATAAGQVILAGRTTDALDRTFGLVIFEAENDQAARVFMASDPAVVANIMSATLHSYSIALQRQP